MCSWGRCLDYKAEQGMKDKECVMGVYQLAAVIVNSVRVMMVF